MDPTPSLNPIIFALIGVLSLALNAGLAWLVWVRKPGEEAAKAVLTTSERVAELLREHQADVDARLQAQHGRLSELEVTVRHMPSADEVRKLEGMVQVIAERTTGVQEGMRGMRSSLARIEQWLVEIKLRPVGGSSPDSRL